MRHEQILHRILCVDRGSLRAGAMWRIMEAGRVYERAYKAAPTLESSQTAIPS